MGQSLTRRRGARWSCARKSALAAAGVAAVLLTAALLWRAAHPLEDAAWARIQADGRILIATDASYEPFSAVDANGDLFGFDVDLADAIARRWGVTAVFENITYDALLGTLIVGRDDAVISAFVAQPERTREVSYTAPYFTGGTVIVIRRAGGPALTGAPEAWAAGKTLAVEYGAGGDALARQWARRAAGVTVQPLATAGEALAAVSAGTADAAVVDAIAAYRYLADQPELMPTGPVLEPQPYVIAVSVDSPVLLEQLEVALAALEADGSLGGLRAKWLGEAAR
ncbi:MAG: amino acid ABC transporter substrate-binding protein [Anaerolineales bacterium]|nr:amino acid ABC transporter substrate-binding protein [Anaerolineales bacterium]